VKSPYRIDVQVSTQYLPAQSAPDQQRFAFAYTVRIKNVGTIAAQLRSRHWIITDSNAHVEEVRGPGVIGQQPLLEPGAEFEYRSGAVIATAVGTMRGSYQMVAVDGHGFDAEIPMFTLSTPRTLH
jgi:ApaG protein